MKKKLGRPKKVHTNQEYSEDELTYLQMRLHKNIVHAIRLMCLYHKVNKPEMTTQIYLNNFFKDFILHEATVIDNEGLVKSIKEVLDKVRYV